MVKLLVFSIFFSIFSIISSNAQVIYDKNCYYGISFEVSNNPNWGYGELVITSVDPNSPAETAGIKVGDIIMEVNGKATYLRDNETIAKWLYSNNYDPEVTFTIRNMNTYFKTYKLTRSCLNIGSVSEYSLAGIYSFYSLEDTSQRSFALPIKTELNAKADFTDYYTYDIYQGSEGVVEVDKLITGLVEKELQSKGMTRNTRDPDLLVQIYYNYQSNPSFSGVKSDSTSYVWRYDIGKKEMARIPVYDPNTPSTQLNGQYIASCGVAMYDRKYIDSTQLTQIWDCHIQDYLADGYLLNNYLKLHIPLLMMQFPYTDNGGAKTDYRVNFTKYNYTGIYYDKDNLNLVKDVDTGSPAFKAGIRAGYIIRKINDRDFGFSNDVLSEAYKRFINETITLRNTSTRYTNAQGFQDCMLWNKAEYAKIAKEFSKPSYLTQFAYLYEFEPFVNRKYNGTIAIEAWDGMQLRVFTIKPEIRKSVVIKTL